jgi:hypothetical protein
MVRTVANDLDALAELARLSLDLYAVVEVLFKVSTIEDAVCGGLRVVDDKLVLGGGGFSGGGFGLEDHQPTEKDTQQSMMGETDHGGGGGGTEKRAQLYNSVTVTLL